MKVEKKILEKSQVELTVEMTIEEFAPYAKKGAELISREIKIDGFRPGKAPYEIIKQKIGEMTILEEGARIAISKTLDQIIKEHVTGDPVGQPKIDITKLAPGNPLEFKVVLALLPEIKLGEYKDLKIKQEKTEAKKEEVEKTLADLREMRVKEAITDRAVADGDKVMVDIEMFLDKVPVEGGKNKSTAVLVGKNYIVPGFDKNLLGAKKDEVREFSLPYPKDYHMKNLAGKNVEFKVKINDVYSRELPELNDDFALGFGLKKFTELEKNIKESIAHQKRKEAEQKSEREMLEKIVAKTKFGDLAEVLVEHESHSMLAELEHAISAQGGRFEDYLASIGKTRDQLVLDMLPEAVKRVKVSLLVREIAKEEKIKVSAEDIEENVKEMKKHYKDDAEAVKKVDTEEYRHYITNVLASRKVIDKLRKWNITE